MALTEVKQFVPPNAEPTKEVLANLDRAICDFQSRVAAELAKLSLTKADRYSLKQVTQAQSPYLALPWDLVRGAPGSAPLIVKLPPCSASNVGVRVAVSRAHGVWPVRVSCAGSLVSGAAYQDIESQDLTEFVCTGLEWRDSNMLESRRYSHWNPVGNATTAIIVDGLTASATGTATARNVAVTNALTIERRLGYVSAALAGSSAGLRTNALQFSLQQGFRFRGRIGASDAAPVADARTFFGLRGTAAVIGNVNPTTLTNIIGIGCDNGQANLRLLWNDGAGTASSLDLGSNFPSASVADCYELYLEAAPNASLVSWRVTRVGTIYEARGQLSADIPALTQLLAIEAWRNNGATALAVGIDICNTEISIL